MRLSDAKQVEAKAARIKDWVTNKLRDLEEQNEHLKAQNERATAQMEILRQKLEQLQIDRDAAATAAFSANAAGATEMQENVTSPLENINDTTKSGEAAPAGIDDAMRPIPPPRTKFPTPTPTLVRKATADTVRRRPESADVLVDCGGAGAGGGEGGRDGIGGRRPKAATAAAVAEEHCGLPDKHRSLHMPLAPFEGKKLSKKGAADLLREHVALPLAPLNKIMSDESNDYSEIFTPNAEDCNEGTGGTECRPDAASDYGAKEGERRTGSGDSGLTGLSSTGTAEAAVEAPLPPLHRYPSWEDRIYRVAREGFPQGGGSDSVVGEGGNARNSMCGGYGNDVVVPVYASVKGVRHHSFFFF